jgi:DNA-binding XRE family transcriptional regulator
MTIKKIDIKLIKNTHLESTDLLLNKLLKDNDMSQADLAKAVGKDATTINRWVKNSRAIAWENAIELARVLKCHPVDIYQPKSEIVLRWFVNSNFAVQKIDQENQYKISIPFEYYNTNMRAILANIPGSHVDGEVCIFDIPKVKKFSSQAIGKYCYCTTSKSFKKKYKNADDIMGILKSNEDYTFSILNPLTREPIKPGCHRFSIEDLEIATPVKIIFNPNFLHKQIDY